MERSPLLATVLRDFSLSSVLLANIKSSCSTNFITNPIPFVSLHICMIVGFFRHMVLGFLFDIAVPPWFVICSLLLAILATNRKAQKHVALRIRQKLSMMTVGRNNAVHPIISVALVQLGDQVDGVTSF